MEEFKNKNNTIIQNTNQLKNTEIIIQENKLYMDNQ